MTFPTAEDMKISIIGQVECNEFSNANQAILIDSGSTNPKIAESLKQQILLDHKIVERLKERIKELHQTVEEFSYGELGINACMIESELKSILENN